MDGCIFCKIVAGEIPATVLYEDADHLAFRDLNPAAPIHAVLVPKRHWATLFDAPDTEAQGKLMQAACGAARALGLDRSGFRVVANYGPDGGQEVMHVHYHIVGGRLLGWPPG